MKVLLDFYCPLLLFFPLFTFRTYPEMSHLFIFRKNPFLFLYPIIIMIFFCEYCQFSAPNKYRYERHLATQKHARNYAAHHSSEQSLEQTLDYNEHDDDDSHLLLSHHLHNAFFVSLFFSFANLLLHNKLFIFCSSFFRKS